MLQGILQNHSTNDGRYNHLVKDKIVIVTGASNGIVKAIVDTFIENGAKVIGLVDHIDILANGVGITRE